MTFSYCISHFFQIYIKFQHFEANMNLIAYALMELRTPKDVVRQMSKKSKSPFRRPYEKQHIKRIQTLLKSSL